MGFYRSCVPPENGTEKVKQRMQNDFSILIKIFTAGSVGGDI